MITYKLKPHQKEGVAYLLKHHYAILGDAMGLGKTLQAIELIKQVGEKAIIVCPAFLRETWADEFKKFSDLKTIIAKEYIDTEYDVVITSYSSLSKVERFFGEVNIVVADEVHYLKNLEAKRTDTFHDFLDLYRPSRFIGLSGTAIKNRVPEFFSLLLLCSYNPHNTSGIKIEDKYASYYSFCYKFCHVKKFKIRGRWVTQFEGHKNIEDLKKLLVGKYIRRKASEVLDLPPIIRKDVVLENEYIDHELLQAWNERSNAYATLKKNSAKIKVKHTIKYAESLMDAGEGPLVIFCDHVEPVQEIAETFSHTGRRVGLITGSTNMDVRARLIKKFQAGELDLIAATIGAMSVGVTLTRARNMIFNSLPFVPADLLQAEKRIHRIGQGESCVIHRIFWGKVDAQIGRLITKKLKTLVEVL